MFEQRCKTNTALKPGKMAPLLILLISNITISRAKFCSISSSQYEMQLKRWNIRKNATRIEWQQYFAADKDQLIANSLGDGPGTNFAPVILSKSTASKKRASRWVPRSIVAPKSVPAPHAVLAPRVSESTSLDNVEHPNGVLSFNEPTMAQRNTGPGSQVIFQIALDSLHATETFPLPNEHCLINDFSIHSVLGSPSQAFADVLSTSAHSSDSSLMLPVVPGLQSPAHGLGDSYLATSSSMGLPAGNNTAIFMLQEIRKMLPFGQFEQSILSKGVVLERSAGQTIFGGFAFRVVASMLSSKDQSMVQQTPDLQRFLRTLDAQIPGESSALTNDDQAFETNFARMLLFSILNGFAGLDDIPMEEILRFLNRDLINKLLLNVLEQSPRYVSRTLADNIFRAAIEATDAEVVDLLLERSLVDVNETVCFHNTKRYTPVERASSLMSPGLMRSLIDAGADINKSHASLTGSKIGGALNALISDSEYPRKDGEIDEWRTVQSESIEAFKTLLAAGAIVHAEMMVRNRAHITEPIRFLISQNARPESHQGFFRVKPISSMMSYLDDRRATRLVQNLISLCHEAGCHQCVVDFNLDRILVEAVIAGKIGLVQLFFHEADVRPHLQRVFAAAIRSNDPAMINFILSHGPDLDPPATSPPGTNNYGISTPIAEAVRSGNENLIKMLEAQGCLDHLTEGHRFQALFSAAADAGNAAYLRKLLACAVTSKEAYRVEHGILNWALGGGHQDIAQMLLEAGALASPVSSLPGTSVLEDMQLLHVMIASGAGYFDAELAQKDQSIVAVLFNEFPEFQFDNLDMQKFLRNCIATDKLDFFRAVFQTLDLQMVLLDDLLLVAVQSGHSNLVEYFLDMGACPFRYSVLQAAVTDKPDMLQILLQKERRQKTLPKCIGARVLEPLMGNDAGIAVALDELIRTGAINLARLEVLYEVDDERTLDVQPEYFDSIRVTPLGMAIQGVPGRFNSNMVAVKKFLEAGADPNGISKSNEQWTRGSPLMTALMVAIETGLEDAVNVLLDYGADANARPRIRTTRTALQFAAEIGNMDMVRLLLSRGADANSSASSRGGATVLQFAAMAGNCNMVAYLLDHGAQLDALPSRIDGMWPMEGAAANGRLDMIRFLWELKVRVEAEWEFPKGFSERQCLRAMNFARENEHIGCMYLVSELSGISMDRLETDEYGAPWIAY